MGFFLVLVLVMSSMWFSFLYMDKGVKYSTLSYIGIGISDEKRKMIRSSAKNFILTAIILLCICIVSLFFLSDFAGINERKVSLLYIIIFITLTLSDLYALKGSTCEKNPDIEKELKICRVVKITDIVIFIVCIFFKSLTNFL